MESNKENKEFIDISGFIKKYIKYWPVVIISLVVCCILGVVYVNIAPRVMQINASILIKEDQGISGTSASAAKDAMQSIAFGGSSLGNTSVSDEILLLGSHSLYRSLGKNLGLNVVYKLKEFPFDKDCYDQTPIVLYSLQAFPGYVKFDLSIKNGEFKVKASQGWKKLGEITTREFPIKMMINENVFYFDTTKYYPHKNINMEIEYYNYDLCAEILQNSVLIDQASKKANVITLTTEDVNIKRGKDIINTLIEYYNKDGEDDKNKETELMDSFLSERIYLMQTELDSVERSMEKYKKENNLTDIDTEAKIILEKSQDFKEKQIEAESQFTVIELVEQFLTKPENKYSLVPLNIGLSDRTVLEGLQKYNEALLERIKLLITTKPSNPAIDLANKQLDAMRANMIETVKSIKSGFSRARNDLLDQENYFLSRVNNMPTQEREFISIKRQQMIKQELFLFLLQKREENALTQALVKPKVKIIDNAYSLSEPKSPKLAITLMVSIVISCIISTIVILCLQLNYKKKR